MNVEIVGCDAEQIHIPGSIQPDGFMLIAQVTTRLVVGYAGRDDAFINENVLGLCLDDVIDLGSHLTTDTLPSTGTKVIGDVSVAGKTMDAVVFISGEYLVVELTDKDPQHSLDASFLAELQAAGSIFDKAYSLQELCQQASEAFQGLTGYGRVLVYHFVDDDAGVVVGESIADASSSFLNHHFPASDIPKQARALYVRNRVRVITDVNYVPVPIVGIDQGLAAIDLSDSMLRSVSPIHIQYLKNMGVAASASMSIIVDGVLWGLVACHHNQPRPISLTAKLACQALASSLSRRIKARQENELYRERPHLRSQEDLILSYFGVDDSLPEFFEKAGADLAMLMQATGFAALQGSSLLLWGKCPDPIDVR
ncbi:GAF domain-containing protein, partial [Kaistia terrae]